MQPRRGRYKIAVISVGHLCHDIYTSFLSPILPLLIEKFSLSFAAAGFISVLIRVPSLFSPYVGAVVDRRTMKHIVILSPTVTAAAMCLMGVAPNYYFLSALSVLVGISSTCFHVPSPVLIHEIAGRRVGAAMSSFQIGGELSRTVGPLVVLCAVSLWSLEGIYRLIPLGAATSLMLLAAFGGLQPPEESPDKTGPQGVARIAETIRGARGFYLSIFGVLLCKSCSASVLAAFLPTYLSSQGKSVWLAGSALAFLQGCAIVGVFLSGVLSDKIGCTRMILIITVLTPLAMMLFVCAHGYLFVAALVLVGLSAFSSTPALLSLIQKHGFAFPATANGIYMAINFFLGSLAVMAAGFLADRIGIGATFNVCALGAWLGIPAALLLLRTGRECPVDWPRGE